MHKLVINKILLRLKYFLMPAVAEGKKGGKFMKSIKPGRGPSMMSGVMSIAVGIFGLFWTIMAASIGGGFMALFGLVFIGIAISSAVYNFKNATSENRYSTYDIVDSTEESDPFNERFGKNRTVSAEFDHYADGTPLFSDESVAVDRTAPTTNAFCPYCGNEVEKDFIYCNNCGKELPRD